MAQITLSNLRHSYHPNPKSDADYALKKIDLTWEDGGAYALLGPSAAASPRFSTSSPACSFPRKVRSFSAIRT